MTQPLDERLTAALVEKCATALDETDVANVVAVVLPVVAESAAAEEIRLHGRLVEEIPREKNESQRTWIGGGDGHMDLTAARRWSMDRVEQVEQEVVAATEVVREATQALSDAHNAHDKASADLHRLRARLAAARQDLAWRTGMTDRGPR